MTYSVYPSTVSNAKHPVRASYLSVSVSLSVTRQLVRVDRSSFSSVFCRRSFSSNLTENVRAGLYQDALNAALCLPLPHLKQYDLSFQQRRGVGGAGAGKLV